ncbi:hypothetical protein [Paracidovorax cattleyae]|uniref:Uncharacterized protein n=1 Tax=Paracidovorax cattleyae TaxID=80868 RepID=A0A1H0REX0_9BURK|nr:hypothetical protein [Paracidovorax cattleyae]SDP27920.1 hypothetical protein SAMN04489708_11028 [Paracidovorax cattleyae]
MSRSGYTDDYDDDPLAGGRWRAAVKSAINGKRGQQALREILAALDAMPEQALIGESLVTAEGEFCTLGVLGQARGLDMRSVDPEDWDAVAALFNLAPAMVREVVFENDEVVNTYRWVDVEICGPMPPRHFRRPYGYERHRRTVCVTIDHAEVARHRWRHMRAWVASQIKEGDPHER